MGWYWVYTIIYLVGFLLLVGAFLKATDMVFKMLAAGLALWLLVSLILEFRVVLNR